MSGFVRAANRGRAHNAWTGALRLIGALRPARDRQLSQRLGRIKMAGWRDLIQNTPVPLGQNLIPARAGKAASNGSRPAAILRLTRGQSVGSSGGDLREAIRP